MMSSHSNDDADHSTESSNGNYGDNVDTSDDEDASDKRSPMEPKGRIIRKGRGGLRHLRHDVNTSDIDDTSSKRLPLEPQGRKGVRRHRNVGNKKLKEARSSAETEGNSSVQHRQSAREREQSENEQGNGNEVTVQGTTTEPDEATSNNGKMHSTNTTSESDQLDGAREHVDELDNNNAHDIEQGGGENVSAPSREDIDLGEEATLVKPGAVAVTYEETPPKNPEYNTINDSDDIIPGEGKVSNNNEDVTPPKNPAYRANGNNLPEWQGNESNGDALDATSARASTDTELPTAIEAYTVERSDDEVIVATPALPWWKQQKVKILLTVLIVVIVALVIALGVSLSSTSSSSSNGDSNFEQTPTISPALIPSTMTVSQTPPQESTPPTITHQTQIQSPTMPLIGSMKSMKLLADDGASDGQFGQSISIYNDTLIVGSSGSASIYQRDPDTNSWTDNWALKEILMQGDDASLNNFGYSVGIYDNIIVVGAPGDIVNGESSGSVYIYKKDSDANIWTLQQKLVPNNGAALAQFGFKVVIHENIIVVGAPYDGCYKGEIESMHIDPWNGCHDGVESSGSIYIYQHNFTNNEWALHQKLFPDDGVTDWFGLEFALYKNTLVISAFDQRPGPALDNVEATISEGHIYQRNPINDEWTLHHILAPRKGLFSDRPYVAIFNNTLILGTGYYDDNGHTGSVLIYARDTGTKEWVLQQTLTSGETDDLFGYSIAIFENTIIVGAERDDHYGADSGGAYIYIFDTDTNEWILQEPVVAYDGVAFGQFGKDVAIFDHTVVISSNLAEPDKNTGSVYVYS